MGKFLKKINKSKQIEFICEKCKIHEFIPKDVVEYFDDFDSDGVDNSYPPRFECKNCDGLMVPIYYKSVHGFIHEYKDI